MEQLAEIIGATRALCLQLDTRFGELDLQCWHAELVEVGWEDETHDVVATARIARVHFDLDWYDSLDAESGDLEAVADAFKDPDVIANLDEESYGSRSLVILDHVEVAPQHRGARLSHALALAVGHIFIGDIIALIPASMSQRDDGELYTDAAKGAALRRHWARAGFVDVPDSNVMILPVTGRT